MCTPIGEPFWMAQTSLVFGNKAILVNAWFTHPLAGTILFIHFFISFTSAIGLGNPFKVALV